MNILKNKKIKSSILILETGLLTKLVYAKEVIDPKQFDIVTLMFNGLIAIVALGVLIGILWGIYQIFGG